MTNYRATRRMRADNPIPMTSAAYLRWLNKQPRPALYVGDTIRATGDGSAGNEMDNGYLGAIRLAPRCVGLADGQVPLAVALRLLRAGLVARVVPETPSAANDP